MFAVLVPVGPGSAELARLADALDSIRAFEAPGNVHLVLVDDATKARELRVNADEWASLDVVRTACGTARSCPIPTAPWSPAQSTACARRRIDGLGSF